MTRGQTASSGAAQLDWSSLAFPSAAGRLLYSTAGDHHILTVTFPCTVVTFEPVSLHP